MKTFSLLSGFAWWDNAHFYVFFSFLTEWLNCSIQKSHVLETDIHLVAWISTFFNFPLFIYLHYCILRSPSRGHHANPYAREWSGVRPEAYSTSIGQSSDMERGSWVDRPGQSFPMGPLTTQPEHPAWRHDLSKSIYLSTRSCFRLLARFSVA